MKLSHFEMPYKMRRGMVERSHYEEDSGVTNKASSSYWLELTKLNPLNYYIWGRELSYNTRLCTFVCCEVWTTKFRNAF